MQTIKIRDDWSDNEVIEEITLNDKEYSIYKMIRAAGADFTSCGCCQDLEQNKKIAAELVKEIIEETNDGQI